MRSVVGGVEHDGVVGDAELIKQVQHLADLAVVLHHAVSEDAEPGDALARFLQMGVEVHARGRQPGKPGRAGFRVAFDEVHGAADELLVGGLHALLGQRTGVLALLHAHRAEARIIDVARGVGGLAVEHAARTELGTELRVLRVVRVLRLFLCIQVIEVAIELVEAMHRRQELIAVAEVVLTELAGGVTQRLQ